MHLRLSYLLLAISAAACGPGYVAPKPCTSCSNVAGNYVETITAEPATLSSCGMLFATGGSGQTQVLQPDGGSSIQFLPSGFTGSLNTDQSVSFAAIAQEDSLGDPGTLALTGSFLVVNGVATQFNGTYDFTLTSSGCHISATTVWAKQ